MGVTGAHLLGRFDELMSVRMAHFVSTPKLLSFSMIMVWMGE